MTATERHLEEELNKLSSIRLRNGGLARNLALALALASGTALLVAPAFTDAAHAQKKDKKKGKDEAATQYSKEFIAAFKPLQDALAAGSTDAATLKPLLDAVLANTQSPDEKKATGSMVLNVGLAVKDVPMQLQGVEMMIDSGKVAPEELGKFTFNAYVLSNNTNQTGKARDYLLKTIALNYSTPTASIELMQNTVAELYFQEENYRAGIAYLSDAFAQRQAAGTPVAGTDFGRPITVAYQNEVFPELWNLLEARQKIEPSTENWRDWVGRVRNLSDLEDQALLDLLRFARKVGVLNGKSDYVLYVEAADARRLPKEVKDIIDEAYAGNLISKDDIFIADSLTTANGRIKTDQAELPVLEKDANAASATVRTVFAAGDAFLSYGQHAKAVGFYEKSLTMAGVDRNAALTRLGIAQIGVGDHAAAQATLAQVEGPRAPIARLWGAYAAQQAAGTTTAPVSGD